MLAKAVSLANKLNHATGSENRSDRIKNFAMTLAEMIDTTV